MKTSLKLYKIKITIMIYKIELKLAFKKFKTRVLNINNKKRYAIA